MVQYDGMVLVYTNKCNIKCAHCIADAGPERDERFSVELARECIREMAYNGLREVTFTGGEPLLFFDELIELISYAKNLGLASVVVTNAFWAESRGQALQYLEHLSSCGLKELQISTGRFHLEHIPIENAVNAVNAAKELGLDMVLMISSINNDQIAYETKRVFRSLNVEIMEQEVVPFGERAKELENEFELVTTKGVPVGSCGSIMTPSITPDGNVHACCSSSSDTRADGLLVLGNVHKESLGKLIQKSKENALLDLLYIWGPCMIVKWARKDLESRGFTLRESYHGVCELCYDILNTSTYSEDIKRLLENDEILLKLECAKLIEESVTHSLNNHRETFVAAQELPQLGNDITQSENCPKACKGLIHRPFEDKHIVYYAKKKSVVVLNETSREILQLCDGTNTVPSIVRILEEKYAGNHNVKDKVLDHVQKLGELRLISISEKSRKRSNRDI